MSVESKCHLVVFNGQQVTCNLSLSHRDTHKQSQPNAWVVSSLREPVRMPSPLDLLVCRIAFTRRIQQHGGSCETHGATLCSRHSCRLVLTPGRRSGVFTYGRTSTCNFLLRFGLLPKRLSITFQCHTDVLVDFCTVTREGYGSVVLLCCWCLARLYGLTEMFI